MKLYLLNIKKYIYLYLYIYIRHEQLKPAYFDCRKALHFQKICHSPPFLKRKVIPSLSSCSNKLILIFLLFVCFLSITGVIRTALHNMDREAREHYSVVIQAKDMAGQVGGLSGSTTVNITLTDVNDNPPRFPQSMYNFSI